jgi:Beta-galactosidase
MRVLSHFALMPVIAGCLLGCSFAAAQTVVFQQPGFPTIDSEPLSQSTLSTALGGAPVFANVDRLRSGEVLKNATLLVFPYGSAFPADAWPSVLHYVQQGGNLLLLGGQPFRVPVTGNGTFTVEHPQDSYAKAVDFRHSYAVPLAAARSHFAWRQGYSFLPQLEIGATKIFAQEGRLQGLGYLDAQDGTHLAAPVIVADRFTGGRMPSYRIVALPFTPTPGYWASTDGLNLIRTAARYAQTGAVNLQIEAQYNTLRPGENPQLTAHLRGPHITPGSTLDVQLIEDGKPLDHAHLTLTDNPANFPIPFSSPLPAGVYTVRATWTPTAANTPQEFAENGFQVEDVSALATGEALDVKDDFLTLGGKPFFPVGTNYFTTEENGWDFSGPRNAAVWERDFADMERHSVNFVRTGVWMGAGGFLDPTTAGANERFLRNLEAFLAAAHRHHIAVNFTFFAFTPRVAAGRPAASTDGPPPANPYLDNATIAAEKAYIVSVVQRFGNLPWLSYDLINEPSFSNPRNIFHGNVPNGDPAEQAAWQAWLQKRYATLASLADAWRTTTGDLEDWPSIPLPKPADLKFSRYANAQQVRAFDYNLFAQDMFSNWVHTMVAAIRATGSHQLINVGQDEGGVSDRVLNQFYATSGVSFTTNHTYWQDDALLWDSVVAKRPGMPNITGETGYQPAWDPDGAWRYDELTGTAIVERKWALGFAAGSSGAMQWDWAREPDFGMERSDGSAKIWQPMLRDLGDFARKTAPYATGLTLPEVAIVLPQSLQLSTHNQQAIDAQQAAVRVLYQYNRAEAYAVGEYQIDTLGTPKLIILPSPYGLSEQAWTAIETRVRAGAVLLVSGPFSADEHMHPTDRAHRIGIDATLSPLQLRDETLHLPSADVPLEFPGLSTTILDRDTLPGGATFVETPLGKGKILFSTLPIELNSNLASVAKVYDYALKIATIGHTYTTTAKNPGILICPTRLPHATLYVLTSETETAPISFTDMRSGKSFSGTLDAGRAAVLLVGEHGGVLANYRWHGSK